MQAENEANKKSDSVVFTILIVFYLVVHIMPFFAQITNTYLYLAVVLLIYFVIILKNPKMLNRYISLLLPFIALIVLNLLDLYFNYSEEIAMYCYRQILELIPVLLASALIINKKHKTIYVAIIITILAFVITAITTYIGLSSDPMAARYIATVADSKDPYFISLNMKNIGGFDTVYSIVLIYPMLICLYKHRKIKPLIMAAIVAIIFVYVLKTQYATALILFIFSSFLLIQGQKFSLKKAVFFIITMIVFLIVFLPLVASLLDWLASKATSDTLSERFIYIADMLTGTKTSSDAGGRTEVLLQSVTAFSNHPLLGNFLYVKNAIGGHSFILDTLGQFGLLGAGALYVMYRAIYKYLYKPFRSTEYYGYMIWSFLQTILLSTINTGKWLLAIAFFVPLAAYLMQHNDYILVPKGTALARKPDSSIKTVDSPSLSLERYK